MSDEIHAPAPGDITFDLLHIADSALPVGGYAFSNGLEAASKLGFVRTRPELEAYLRDMLMQQADMELPFIRAAHAEGVRPGERLAALMEEWAATLTSAAVQRGSLRQGKGMLRWLEAVHRHTHVQALQAWMAQRALPPHYVPVFAVGLCRLGISADRTAQLFLFMSLRDQVGAAVRLGLVGPMDGQCLQHALQETARQALQDSTTRDFRDAARGCPAIELSQGYHDHLYSRLFQS